ncbi:CvpA family protein [bacterium]|nr:CvpA family protein [bacterium]
MFTFLDFIFLVVVVVSAVFAYNGGLISEAFGIVAWILTAIFTKYLYPFVEPRFASLFGESNVFSSMSAYVSVFVICIMFLSFVNKSLAGKLHNTNLGGIDKSLGFFFGLVRGILIMAIAYIAILWFIPNKNERPKWIVDARSKPILKVSSMFISILLPDGSNFREIKEVIKSDMTGNEVETFEKLSKPSVQSDNDGSSAEDGYKDSEIRDLERQLKQLDQMELEYGDDLPTINEL